MTITEFLMARIAEDEAEAMRWQAAMDEDETLARGTPVWIIMAGGIKIPTRVLAECEAKRRIASRCDMILRGRGEGMFDEGRATDARDNLRALALPYADHPDFREEWRVS